MNNLYRPSPKPNAMPRMPIWFMLAIVMLLACLTVADGYAQNGAQPVVVNFAASGDNTVVAGATAKRVQIYELYFTVAAATNITIKDGAGTALTGPITFTGAGSFTLMWRTSPAHFTTSLGNAFIINSSNAVQVSGRGWYATTN